MPDSQFSKFISRFAVLRGATRELWITFAIKFLSFAAYSITSLTLKRWLSTEFGYNDQQALALIAAWSITMTIVTLLVGSLTDAIGLRKTFFLGVWVCLGARLVMALATKKHVALSCGLFPLAIGEALGTPVLVAAVRRYSNTSQRSISFSLAYMMSNAGGVAAGFLFDGVREALGERGHFPLPFFGTSTTTYRTLFLVAWAIQLLMLPLLHFIRQGLEATDDGVQFLSAPVTNEHYNLWASITSAISRAGKDTVRLFAGLIKQSGFYRLLAFLLLVAFLKLIFMQMNFVFPEFGIRELGEGAPVGKLWSVINSTLVIILVPIIGALTQKFSAYRMVVVGGIISAASVFIMAMPPKWFAIAANGPLGDWIGHLYLGLHGNVHPYYVMIVLFVALLSIGEAFYSPRVYEYAAAIAPKGQEASYGALSYIPFLLGKLLIGIFSGALLAKYCPEHGERHSETLWLFVALTASIAPIGLISLRRFIRVPEAGRQSL